MRQLAAVHTWAGPTPVPVHVCDGWHDMHWDVGIPYMSILTTSKSDSNLISKLHCDAGAVMADLHTHTCMHFHRHGNTCCNVVADMLKIN